MEPRIKVKTQVKYPMVFHFIFASRPVSRHAYVAEWEREVTFSTIRFRRGRGEKNENQNSKLNRHSPIRPLLFLGSPTFLRLARAFSNSETKTKTKKFNYKPGRSPSGA